MENLVKAGIVEWPEDFEFNGVSFLRKPEAWCKMKILELKINIDDSILFALHPKLAGSVKRELFN